LQPDLSLRITVTGFLSTTFSFGFFPWCFSTHCFLNNIAEQEEWVSPNMDYSLPSYQEEDHVVSAFCEFRFCSGFVFRTLLRGFFRCRPSPGFAEQRPQGSVPFPPLVSPSRSSANLLFFFQVSIFSPRLLRERTSSSMADSGNLPETPEALGSRDGRMSSPTGVTSALLKGWGPNPQNPFLSIRLIYFLSNNGPLSSLQPS